METRPEEKKETLGLIIAQWLKKQLARWTAEGILNQNQKEAIRNLYVLPEQETVRPSGDKPAVKLVVILEAIGAFLIGIGVISLIAFNWPELPNYLKLFIIIAGIVLSHLTGFFLLAYRPKFQKAGFSFIFLGNMFYGAGIWLIAQMYHMNYGYTTGMFLWALGIVPFAYLLKSKLNYFLAVILFIVWTFGESFGDLKPHLPFLIILLGLLGPLSYYLKSRIGLCLCVITGGAWLLINNIFWFGDNMSIHLVAPLALYGVMLLAASNLHATSEHYKEYRQIYLVIGLIITSIAIAIIPLFGPIELSPQALTLNTLPVSFWTCTGLLLAGVLAARILTQAKALDPTGMTINKMLPFLLAAALYVFVMPFIKSFMVLSLVPVILVAVAYWYFSKSIILTNVFLVYLFFWLPFCLIQWEQPLMLFLLYLVYGTACYLLGWTYISKLKNNSLGNAFKFFGLFAVFAALYAFASSLISKSFMEDYAVPASFDFWLLLAVFFGVALILYNRLAGFIYPTQTRGLLPEERIMVPILFIIPAVLFAAYSNNITGVWYTFFVNFFFLCLLIVCLIAGYRRSETYLKILSLVFLALLVGTRFIEIEWSLLYKSMLFILTGIIVLTGGIIFEKNKDKVAIIEQ